MQKQIFMSVITTIALVIFVGMSTSNLMEQNAVEWTKLIYPNPASDYITISIESETVASATLDIYTTDGTRIATRIFELSKDSNVYNYSTSNYTSGIYLQYYDKR